MYVRKLTLGEQDEVASRRKTLAELGFIGLGVDLVRASSTEPEALNQVLMGILQLVETTKQGSDEFEAILD